MKNQTPDPELVETLFWENLGSQPDDSQVCEILRALRQIVDPDTLVALARQVAAEPPAEV